LTSLVNQQSVLEFRERRGVLSGDFEDTRVVILSTTDPAGGTPVAETVAFHHDEGGRLLIVAAASEDGSLPRWYGNVLADPRVSVETGTSLMEAEARPLSGRERDVVYARLAQAAPALEEKQRLIDAAMPIVVLEPLSRARLGAEPWGAELIAVHDGLRRELALVRSEFASSGPKIAAQLRINCLVACGMLNHHHVSEDEEVFPLLERRRPELAPALTLLREQHRQMQQLLDRLREAVADEAAGPAWALAEVDRLTVELEEHLDYEEEQLVSLLNSVTSR
jgi:deazaflavin-dependent oxidoreductase (nitroreductase family)